MKWAFSSAGLVAAGLVGVVIILLFQNLTINNEEDYYLLKEMTEAAMIDAIDLAYYRDTGELKIVQEKFVENFTRRFAEAANVINTNNYYIEFFDIMEIPPKVSVLIVTDIGQYTIFGNHLESQNYGVANSLDAVIEREETYDNIEKYDECNQSIEYYSIVYTSANNGVFDSYTPVTIGDPSNYGYEGDWEIRDFDENYKPDFLTHLHTSTQVRKYDENFDKMYPNYPHNGWETDANYEYFAFYQETPEFEVTYNSESDSYKVYWEMGQYECLDAGNFVADNGSSLNGKCFLGIAYKIDWYNRSCAE